MREVSREEPSANQARTHAPRQSNFELLHILAMFMIVAHHMVRFASPSLESLPLDAKWLYFFTIETGGEVGVDIFLIISAWFLAGRAQTLKSALGHVAKTEAVVLFYSITLFVLSKYVFRLQGLPDRLALRSIGLVGCVAKSTRSNKTNASIPINCVFDASSPTPLALPAHVPQAQSPGS